MKFNGKRMGRMSGKLDDMIAQTEAYLEAHPTHDGRTREKLLGLIAQLAQAQAMVDELARDANAQD